MDESGSWMNQLSLRGDFRDGFSAISIIFTSWTNTPSCWSIMYFKLMRTNFRFHLSHLMLQFTHFHTHTSTLSYNTTSAHLHNELLHSLCHNHLGLIQVGRFGDGFGLS